MPPAARTDANLGQHPARFGQVMEAASGICNPRCANLAASCSSRIPFGLTYTLLTRMSRSPGGESPVIVARRQTSPGQCVRLALARC